MPKRKAAAGAEVASRRSPRLAANPKPAAVAKPKKAAAPKKAAKGKKAAPAENGDAKAEAPKAEAAADAK